MGYQGLTAYVNKGDHIECYTSKMTPFLIDKKDLSKIIHHCWSETKDGRIVSRINGKTTYLWRHLLSNPKGVIDHINGDNKDNRRHNLRVVTQLENARNNISNNKYGCNGIRMTAHGRYNARITVNYKQIHIGNYETLEEAIKARIAAEQKHFGAYAPTSRY